MLELSRTIYRAVTHQGGRARIDHVARKPLVCGIVQLFLISFDVLSLPEETRQWHGSDRQASWNSPACLRPWNGCSFCTLQPSIGPVCKSAQRTCHTAPHHTTLSECSHKWRKCRRAMPEDPPHPLLERKRAAREIGRVLRYWEVFGNLLLRAKRCCALHLISCFDCC